MHFCVVKVFVQMQNNTQLVFHSFHVRYECSWFGFVDVQLNGLDFKTKLSKLVENKNPVFKSFAMAQLNIFFIKNWFSIWK